MRPPEFWGGTRLRDRLVARALSPFGAIYGTTVAYKAMHARPYRSRAKVICVGNLTVGGSGKTPVVATIADELTRHKRRPFILTRGYRGSERGPRLVNIECDEASDVGDEALLLAAHAPVIVSRDRAAGAKLAEEHGADIIVMDDGHQNFSLTKDLSIVVVDGEARFGNGFVVPAGPLRERVAQGLARADTVVLMGACIPLPFNGPVLRARLAPAHLNNTLGQPLVAFAGIGRPEKFFRLLRELGAQLAATRAFPDHHRYSQAELADLRQLARGKQAALIATEKDYARLAPGERSDICVLPVHARFEDEEALARLIEVACA